MKSVLKALLFLIIGLGILFLIYYQVNKGYQAQCQLDGIPSAQCSLLQKLSMDIRSTRWTWLVLMIAVYMLSNISRTLKWLMLLKPLGYQPKFLNALLAIMIGYFTNLGFPRAGELIRSGILSKYENFDMEKVIGTVVIDRLTDVLCLLGFIFLACILAWDKWTGMLATLMQSAPLAKEESGGQHLLLYLMLLGLLGISSIYLLRKSGFLSKIFERLYQAYKGFREGLLSVAHMKKKWTFVFHTVIIWIFYYLMVYFGFKAFDPTAGLGLIPALLIFILGGLGMVIPTPGGMGSYHYLVMMGLASYGISQAEGFSFAMIMFLTIHLFGNIFFGLLSFAVLPLYNNKRPKQT